MTADWYISGKERNRQMIGIIGAMDEEVNKHKEALEDVTVETVAGMSFNKGLFNGKEVVIVRSGIGKVNAGICTQVLADKYGVDYIINTGIAGSLKNEINIGDIVLSEDAIQHDMEAVAFGYEPGVIPRMEISTFKGDARLIDIARSACKTACPEVGVHVGRVLTGDQFISDKAVKNRLVNTFAGCCCEMEGAAIAQAAYLNNIPFIIIRAISDKADDSASMDYPAFEAMAIENSVKLVTEMIKEI